MSAEDMLALVVTQADRDAAAEYMRRFPDLRLSEAFARYRRDTLATLTPRIAELEALLAEVLEHPAVTLCDCQQPDCLTVRIGTALEGAKP